MADTGPQLPTSLHLAAERGLCQVLCAMSLHPLDPKACAGRRRWTPLHVAAHNGYAEDVCALLALEGVEVDALDTEQCTPLWLAAVRGAYCLCAENWSVLHGRIGTGVAGRAIA